jgi:PEP-CTERM motif
VLFDIQSLTIRDNSGGLGGASGAFSGFDLDAVKISSTDCASAACAASAAGLAVFNFGAGTIFTPGTQRAPADPKLFGTDATGAAVNNAVATLGAFDADSNTGAADGFLSLGDLGTISFNLSSAISGAGRFLYIGEVGDNGELAASSIEVRDAKVPEPGTTLLLGSALLAALGLRRRRG